jgi:hypothetical protein
MTSSGTSPSRRGSARDGAIDLRELLSAHVDELADAVLERFAAGAGPAGAPDAVRCATCASARGRRSTASWRGWPASARSRMSRSSSPMAAPSRRPGGR